MTMSQITKTTHFFPEREAEEEVEVELEEGEKEADLLKLSQTLYLPNIIYIPLEEKERSVHIVPIVKKNAKIQIVVQHMAVTLVTNSGKLQMMMQF